MSESFEQNLLVIGDRWPGLLARLLAEDSESLPVELVEGLDSTLSVGGIQLTSRHDRTAEARLQAASLPPQSPLLHLYGTGLGDLQQVLLERPTLQRLCVHVLNGALFKLVLGLLDQQSWLNDPRVELSYAADHPEILLPFFALPAELVLADDYNARMRDRLVGEVHLTFNNREFDPQSTEIVQRLLDTREVFGTDRDVAELFETRPGQHLYVIGTGPTLEQQFDKLRAISAQPDRPLLISVDTAYRPLREQGIRPDIVVSIDQRIGFRHLPPELSDGIPLVYMPMSDPQVLHAWKGPRYGGYSISPIYASVREQCRRGLLFVGGSVLHPAVDLAVKMGAARITLFGADFAFPMNKTHAGWNDGDLGPGVDLAQHWVMDGQGQRVRTQLNFRRYLVELERYIARHPQVAFFNSSRAGARIVGAGFDQEFVQ
ncbi:motility associated factor glycosyltransferase family protein [Pseudomonas gingeri]|uniref:Motility associated factor glycosyltransferase family protein n=1 Tax=Pseudomonas gingeri TaxID=117681 RepID=A0A7Y7X854_9PSED|nr:6-hydroxymethylpterin diphosphokinase MptE-like protein [Pseudomonas gingeri]NWB95064.1 motility associated factor glycosyltransferase family protein [Pseudomonas gingeri]